MSRIIMNGEKMRDFKGYQLFGILFFFVMAEVVVISCLFAKFLVVTGAGRQIVEVLILAGAVAGLYFREKADKVLKKNEMVKKFLDEIGFLLYFRLFSLFFGLTALLSILSILPFWFPKSFDSNRLFYSILATLLPVSSGVLYGSWKFIRSVENRYRDIKTSKK